MAQHSCPDDVAVDQQGQVPPPREFSSNVKLYTWREVVAIGNLLETGYFPLPERTQGGGP